MPDLVRRALALGGGSLHVEGAERKVFSERLYCDHCRQGLAPLDPRLFSFNSRHGACPSCTGLGSVARLNVERVIGPPQVPLKDGLLRFLQSTPWPEGVKMSVKRLQRYWLESLKVNPERPSRNCLKDQQNAMLQGRAGESIGLIAYARTSLAETESNSFLEPFYEDHPCPECHGQRLNSQARRYSSGA